MAMPEESSGSVAIRSRTYFFPLASTATRTDHPPLDYPRAVHPMRGVECLSDFPWVTVRVECPLCPHRRGTYRLARLAEKFGA
jgi:hypothetical protein